MGISTPCCTILAPEAAIVARMDSRTPARRTRTTIALLDSCLDMTKRPQHAVVFDVDGTLLRSAQVDQRLYRIAIENVIGTVRFRDRLDDYRDVTDSGILAQVFEDNDIPPDAKLVTAVKNEFVAGVKSHVATNGPFAEFPGAREFLAKVASSPQFACAIATGGWEKTARIKLDTAGFDISNIPLASADDAVSRTDIMRNALSPFDMDFLSVTYFGDGPWDRDACLQLGWSFRPVGEALSGLSRFATDTLAMISSKEK